MRFFHLVLLLSVVLGLQAQKATFLFQNSISDVQLKEKMETTISSLLTEFNTAQRKRRGLRLDGFDLSEKARRSLVYTWDSIATFSCDFDQNISRCLHSISSDEVREIYVTMHPRYPLEYSGRLNRELSIGFDKTTGQILYVRPTLEGNAYQMVISQGLDSISTLQRLEILKFIEDFHHSYETKDFKSIEKVFTDPETLKKTSYPLIRNSSKAKEQYINKLRDIFNRNRYINVDFNEIEVVLHMAKPDWYGVSLKQEWKAMEQSDATCIEENGYLFTLWDFGQETPTIHLHVWQKEKSEDGTILDSDDKAHISDFFIP